MNSTLHTGKIIYNRRLTNAWASYDWSNSVYNLIVTTAIFPIYYSATTREAFGGEIVEFFGISIRNSVLYTYAISFSFLVIVILSPILSGIADFTGSKKKFMQGFTYLGSVACLGLFFFPAFLLALFVVVAFAFLAVDLACFNNGVT